MKLTAAIDKNKGKLLEQLYSKYSKLMYYIAYSILRDRTQAEDAVQAAFLKVSENNFKIDSILCNKTKALLVIITRNISIEIYNRKKKENVLYDGDELMESIEDQMPLVDIVINNEALLNIQRVLSSLDLKYSEVILMRYYYGYQIFEIASLLGISEQLVRVRLHRARKTLIMKINEEKNDNG